jgi:hypothetical protein
MPTSVSTTFSTATGEECRKHQGGPQSLFFRSEQVIVNESKYVIRVQAPETLSKLDTVLVFNTFVPEPYSIPGDTNIDGVVTPADVTDFVAGWRKPAPVGESSWRMGDFNLDGINNLKDVAIMHQALLDAGLSSPFGRHAIPEPSSIIIAAIAFTVSCGLFGRRRISSPCR